MSLNFQTEQARLIAQYRQVQTKASRWQGLAAPDPVLCWVLMALLILGVLMIHSTSMPLAVRKGLDAFHYTQRHLFYCGAGFMMAYFIFSRPVYIYEQYGKHLLWVSLILLALLYVPGLGVSGGGAVRWLWLGFFTLQVSEVVKLAILLYCAQTLFYMRHEIKTQGISSVVYLFLVCGLPLPFLLLQPDYGSTVLIVIMVFWLLVLADLDRKILLGFFALAAGALIAAFVVEPYRLRRLATLFNPWKDPLGDGYQLTNSLIAIGNGGFFGRGLGESIQKYAYLPEAHNDFIFAIIAEELGFLGAAAVILLFMVFFWRCFLIARRAKSVRRGFAAYYAYGTGILMTSQAMIHIYVNIGLAPTKGITLPLISFGGSSILLTLMMLAILLRIDAEVRMQAKRENKL